MRPYKIVARILLILSVFSLVLAAPIAVREVRGARADAVDRDNNVIIEVGKRGGAVDPPVASSSPSWFWKVWNPSPKSSSAPNDGSGTRPNPSSSSGERKTAAVVLVRQD
jgi:hypothetical protein